MRNPNWDRDELILALDLYLRLGPSNISHSHEEVKKLSERLNALSIHIGRPRDANFRNPNGVYMKLCNFLRVDPAYKGIGLSRGSKLEEIIWNEFASNPSYLRGIAQAIAESITENSTDIQHDESSDTDFSEGKVMYRLHKSRERNSSITRLAKERARKQGNLQCTICEFDFYKRYGELGKDFIECHHTLPLSEYINVKVTRIEDLALVCSNCHSMLHKKRPWLSIGEIKTIIENR